MNPNIVQAGQAMVAVLGGGVALETLAENFLMSKIPPKAQALKPLVIPVVTVSGAAIAAPFIGMPESTAILTALGVWATSVLAHNIAPSAEPDQVAPVINPNLPKGA